MAVESVTPGLRDWLQVDPQHVAAVVRIIAAARLVFVSVGLVALAVDPPQASAYLPLLLIGLSVTTVCSVIVLVAAHVVPLTLARLGPILHAWDFAWIVCLAALTDVANSPFVAYFAFPLLASAYRWGFAATLTTGAAAIVAMLVGVVAHDLWQIGSHVHLHTVMLRVTCLALGTLLVARLADKEWRQRLRSLAATRILSSVTSEAGFLASVRAVLDALLAESGAQRAVLALQEEGRTRVFLWTAERRREDRTDVRLLEVTRASCATYLFDLPPAVGALRIRRDGRSWRQLALDRYGMAIGRAGVAADPLSTTPFAWKKALCVNGFSGQGWTGRLFIFDPAGGHAGRSHLRFLQAVVAQVCPALFNVYLQRRLESRAGGGDRRAVGRAIHDGTLQSLIAAGMELELLKRETGSGMSGLARERLDHVQQLLGEQVLEIRDTIQVLKRVDAPPGRFLDHLEELVRRFRENTGIDARLVCDVETIDLAARTCHELAAVVHEGLVNVRKHANAQEVVVRLSSTDSGWHLHIADNGRGFDFDGRLSDEELGTLRRGPILIRERVTWAGGTSTRRFTTRPRQHARNHGSATRMTTDRSHPVRIVIADDHTLFCEALRRLLEAEPDFAVLATCADGAEAVRLVVELRPDVLLLDLSMPRRGGLEALQELSERHVEVRTIVVTADIDSDELLRAIQLGARGVLLKDSAAPFLFKCVRAVVAGEYWLGRQHFAHIASRLHEAAQRDGAPPASSLTDRELEVVAAVVEGASNRDIGEKFSISPQTVKNHLSHIFDKLGVSSRLELALYAGHHHLLDKRFRGGKRQ